jgi:hypothetical protein
MTRSSRASFVVAIAFLLAPALLSAQATGHRPAPADSASRPRLVPTPATLALADSLLREMDLERVMRTGGMSTFDATIQSQPAMAQFRDVVEAWYQKHLSWAEFGPAMVRVYAETFTEAELRAYVAFYRTPAGRQLARLTPELTRRGAELGAEVAARHTGELQQMIQARVLELQSAGTKPPAPPPR